MPVLAIGGIELIFLAAAILALLLVLCLDLFAHAISGLFPNFSVPVLGSLRQHIIGAINGSIGLVWDACKGSYQFLVHLLNDPIVFFTHFLNVIRGIFAEVIASLTWIKNTLIPTVTRTITNAYVAADTAIRTWVTAFIANVETDLRNGDAAVRSYAAALAADVEGDVRTLYNQSIAYANSIATQVEKDLTAGDAAVHTFAAAIAGQVETDARNLYSQGVAYTNTAVAALDQKATALFNQTEADLARGIITAETTAVNAINGALVTDLPNIWPAVRTGVGDIEDAAAGAFSDVTGLLGNLDLSIPTTIAGALAVTIPITAALSKLAADCTIPNCRNLSQFGKDIQALFGIVEDAGFLAFLAEMITNPTEAAQEAQSTIVPILDDAANAAKSLLGV